jgi:DNA-binding protein HU-beta
MNKSEFVKYISTTHNCKQTEAEKVIDMFVSSATGALAEDNEVSLMGFGNFFVSKVEARAGRNPQTGAAIEISARNMVKFKAGQKLKDEVYSLSLVNC